MFLFMILPNSTWTIHTEHLNITSLNPIMIMFWYFAENVHRPSREKQDDILKVSYWDKNKSRWHPQSCLHRLKQIKVTSSKFFAVKQKVVSHDGKLQGNSYCFIKYMFCWVYRNGLVYSTIEVNLYTLYHSPTSFICCFSLCLFCFCAIRP